MIEYNCPDCNTSEVLLEIVPKKKCPGCQKMMEALEWQGDIDFFQKNDK